MQVGALSKYKGKGIKEHFHWNFASVTTEASNSVFGPYCISRCKRYWVPMEALIRFTFGLGVYHFNNVAYQLCSRFHTSNRCISGDLLRA